MSTHVNAIASSSRPPAATADPDGATKHTHKHKHKSKHHANGDGPSSKKSKKDKDKDKSHPKTPFEHRQTRMRLSIAPRFSGDQLLGVRETLDGMVMRYVPQMQGVLLAHWDHTFLDDTVAILNECPYGVAEVEFETILWAPKVGQKLYGTHSLSSPSHLSLLYNKTFNISIPLQHIPLDAYEFEATDPDAAGADSDSDSDSEDEDGDGDLTFGLGGRGAVEEVGRWKVKSTGKYVGEGSKGVKFTVIGTQVVNSMLSLTGSLLSDPTNPPDISSLPIPAINTTRARDSSPTPEPVISRPTKQPKVAHAHKKALAPVAPASSAGAGAGTVAPGSARPAPKDEIDERFLSARELKQRRKEEERRKRDARKERKEQAEVVDAAVQGGGMAVGMSGVEGESAQEGGKKRKNEDGPAGVEGKSKKKKKDKVAA